MPSLQLTQHHTLTRYSCIATVRQGKLTNSTSRAAATAGIMMKSDGIARTSAVVGTLVQFLVAFNLHNRPLTAEAAVRMSRRNPSKHHPSTVYSMPLSSVPSSSSSTSKSTASGVSGFELDLHELQKRGLSPEDVLRHIRLLAEGRITVDGKCLDGASTSRVDSVRRTTHGSTPPRYNESAAAGQGRGELERKFIGNRTVTCNDGSKSGYCFVFLNKRIK